MEAHACKIEGINSEALWKYGSESNLLCQLVNQISIYTWIIFTKYGNLLDGQYSVVDKISPGSIV